MRRTGHQIYSSTSSLTPKRHKNLTMVREYHVVLNTMWNGKSFKTYELTCGLYPRCVLDHLGGFVSVLWCHLPELESCSFQRVILHSQVSLLQSHNVITDNYMKFQTCLPFYPIPDNGNCNKRIIWSSHSLLEWVKMKKMNFPSWDLLRKKINYKTR